MREASKRSGEPKPTSIPHAQADYALRLMEKGYTVRELARLIEVSVEEMQEAINEAIARR